MSLLVLVHEAREGPAVLGQVLQAHGHKLRFVRLCDGQALPNDLDEVDGIVSMGGPMNVDQADRHAWIVDELALLRKAHDAGRPIVGVCLGAQLLAAALGGQVGPMAQAEIGWHPLRLAFPGTIDALYAGIPWNSVMFHMHGQEVTQAPPGASVLAGSPNCKVQAFRAGLTSYGFQYHFEWDRQDIDAFARSPWVQEKGVEPQAILAAAAEHYDSYRRLGDRLCENIAELLFPIDKR